MHYVVGGVGGGFVFLGAKEGGGHVHPASIPHQIAFRAFRAA